MKKLKILSWNVNGVRAVHGKGFLDWFTPEAGDIVCAQETKASEDQIPETLRQIPGYYAYFVSGQRKGYSGVAIWTKEKPKTVRTELGIRRFDIEARMIQAEYDRFTLFNVYFPNGGASHERLQFKLEFYDSFLYHVASLRRDRIIICGDFNTAHKEIDLARPKQNSTRSGFLVQERAWLDRFVDKGFVDTFRVYNQEPGQYTWWDYQTRARERNVGWRIDYLFVSKALKKNLKSAFIQAHVMGSDHCPVGIEITI